PEKDDHNLPGARDIADRLMASGFHAAVLVPLQQLGPPHRVETDDDSIGGHFLHLLHGAKPAESCARHTSLNLYAEHEFNASTSRRGGRPTGSDILCHHRCHRRTARP
ncbi:hypothetical protein J4711_14025, partial [Staphylococcus epidermidis]|nr:hypothetical protein [Staphylococcus epidermidis]